MSRTTSSTTSRSDSVAAAGEGASASPSRHAPQPADRGGFWLGVAALVLTAALWSLNGPLIKLLNAGGQGVDGLVIACYRSLLGGLLFLPAALRGWRTIHNAPLAWRIGSVLAFTFMTSCFVMATTMTAAANAIVLQYTAPIYVFLLSPLLLRERPRWSEGAALLVAMAGVLVILLNQPPSDARGLLVALASGLGYGALIVFLRGLRAVDPWVVVALNFLGSGLLLTPAVLAFGSFAVTPTQLGVLALMSVVQFALPYVIFSWALRRVEAHRASLITLLEMVLNPIWTLLAVGEAPPRATLLGGPLILAGVVLWTVMTWRNSRSKT